MVIQEEMISLMRKSTFPRSLPMGTTAQGAHWLVSVAINRPADIYRGAFSTRGTAECCLGADPGPSPVPALHQLHHVVLSDRRQQSRPRLIWRV